MKNYRLLLLLLCLLASPLLQASTWTNLWLRPDQQATKLLNNNHPKKAAEKFENKSWQGVANYRARNFEQSVKDFSNSNSPIDNYNLGNSLAHMGKYQPAIKAYDKALTIQPNNVDAKYNKELLEKLMQQQQKQNQQQQNQQSKNQQQQNKQQQSQQSKNQQQQNKQQQNQQSQSQQQGQQQDHDNSAQEKANQQYQQALNKDKNQHTQNKQNKSPAKNNSSSKQNEAQYEKTQAANQWLKRIPDNPGGLLRQKFLRDFQRRQYQKEQQ